MIFHRHLLYPSSSFPIIISHHHSLSFILSITLSHQELPYHWPVFIIFLSKILFLTISPSHIMIIALFQHHSLYLPSSLSICSHPSALTHLLSQLMSLIIIHGQNHPLLLQSFALLSFSFSSLSFHCSDFGNTAKLAS